MMQFLNSQRGGRILVHDGFLYNRKRQNKDGSVTWQCINKQRLYCPGLIKTNSDESDIIEGSEKAHDHLPQENNILKRKVLEEISSSGLKNPVMKPIQVLNQERKHLPLEVDEEMPKDRSMCRANCRKRRRTMPREPRTVAEVPICDYLRTVHMVARMNSFSCTTLMRSATKLAKQKEDEFKYFHVPPI